MGSNVQVVWEKFCRYFDVEPRYLPMEEGRYVITPEQVLDAVDEDTIGVVAILGTTYTGELEPIARDLRGAGQTGGRRRTWTSRCTSTRPAAGSWCRSCTPDVEWDFRLPRVVSINVSGHKYGLTYPGIGFVVWRSAEYLPEELVFRVNYLGGDMPTFTLNFSRPRQPGGRPVLQLPAAGPRRLHPGHECLSQTARWLGDQLRESEHFEVISDGSAIPVVSFRLAGDRGLHRVRRVARAAGLRLAGARLHDAGGRRRTSPCCASWCAKASRPTWPGRCTTTSCTALSHLDELKPSGHFDRAAALRALRRALARRGLVATRSGTIGRW